MELKDRLKQSRKRAGKTQAEVAEAVKMSQPAYQALESGRNLKSSFLPLIANFLNVDPLWLKLVVNQLQKKAMPIYLRWRLVSINLAIPFQMDT